ncbi:hypothetical protein LJR225_000213 [Phenylobacterium sp. LjRoot225]|uniref:extracellular catalytic domain type 2 short-chain-length polyhydroxyalkanoate depolymerase n=1 Tax=Phenylobacterium sp. LjRoot225 TaxID=3342285 RepID=UPI003ED14B96
MPDVKPAKAGALQRYSVTPGGNSISGLSSGAYMTVQIHLAHSASFIGAGVIAGGPYRSVESFRGSALLAEDAYILNAEYICMTPLTPASGPDAGKLAALARETAAANRIDPIEALQSQRVYIFTGSEDKVVHSSVVRATRDFYRELGVRPEAICFVGDEPAGHSILTSNPEDQPIVENRPPYINFGGYMQSHRILDHIYADHGPLKPPAESLTGELVRFDQSEFFADYDARASMGTLGFVYVPGSVKAGGSARGVHIVLHGCKQGYSYVDFVNGRSDRANQATYGARYVIGTGYNHWADANDLIVLYPQCEARDSNAAQNPDGCWDWWGYTSLDRDAPDYYSKDAIQIRAVHAMLARVTGADKPAPRRITA